MIPLLWLACARPGPADTASGEPDPTLEQWSGQPELDQRWDGGSSDGGGGDGGGSGDGGTGDGGDDTGEPIPCEWWTPSHEEGEVNPPLVGTLDAATEGMTWTSTGAGSSTIALRMDWTGDGGREVVLVSSSWRNGHWWVTAARSFGGSYEPGTTVDTTTDWCAQITNGTTIWNMYQARAGDFDGDGYDDLFVTDDAGHAVQGRMMLFTGPLPQGTIPLEPTYTVWNSVGELATSSPLWGDLTGDGQPDLVATWLDWTAQHRIVVMDGTTLGESTLSDSAVYLEGGDGRSRGFAGTMLTDLTGDGIADLHVLSLDPDWGGGWPIYEGPVTEPRDWHDYTVYIANDDWYEALGIGRSGGMDLNGDGYGDLVLGAPEGGPGTSAYGRAFVFHGPLTTTGLASDLAAARLTGDQPYSGGSRFGNSVSAEGDLDGDGHLDLAVAAPYYDLHDACGATFLFYGPIEGELTVADAGASFIDTGVKAMGSGACASNKVSHAGDLDGDGLDDLFLFPLITTGPIRAVFGGPR